MVQTWTSNFDDSIVLPSSLATGMIIMYVAKPTSQMQILRNQQVANREFC